MTRVKICCIESAAEARIAVDAGAHALGLVSSMPSGPGVIDEETIAAIAADTPPAVATFLLTSERDIDPILAQLKRCRPSTLQLVDHVLPGVHPFFRQAGPGRVDVVQVIHVTGRESVEQAVSVAPDVDAILLDSGNPNLDTKELGGTGRTHDWSLSREIVEAVPCPVFLAGGLNPGNIEQAIRSVRPFGVDVCSGLRTDGALDAVKVHDFMVAVARADTGDGSAVL